MTTQTLENLYHLDTQADLRDLLRLAFTNRAVLTLEALRGLTPDLDALRFALRAMLNAGEVTYDPDRREFGRLHLLPIVCPECGSQDVARILYGMVYYPGLEHDLEAGRVILGGCEVCQAEGVAHPAFQCRACRFAWG